jgi:hypothetical protein
MDQNIIVCCGRQVGKTDVVAFKGVIELFYNEFPFECMIISKSEGMARNMFSRIVHLIDKNNILRWCMYSLSKTEGTLDTGARIYSKPAGTEGTSARGPRPKLLIVDEAAYVPDAVFRAISPSVMGVNGYKIYLSTPAGRIGTFWEVWNKSEEFKDWHREQLPHWGVPWNTEDACRKSADLEGYTTDEFRQEYGGEFIDFSLNAFPLNLIKACWKRPPKVKYCRQVGEPDKDYYAGMDVGYTVDETVLMITHKELNSSKHPQYSNEPWWVYVDAIYVWSGMTPAQIALECQTNIFPYWRIRRLNIDSAGKGEALLYAFIDRDKALQSVMNPLPIHSSQVKIELYINALTLMSNFQVKFPNPSHEPMTRKLRMQLAQLKKETTKAGRVVIGHPGTFSGGTGTGHKYHDDHYDALSLALYNYMMMIPNRISLAFASYGKAFGGRR